MERSRQLCTFMTGELHLAVPVAEVQEVIRCQEITPVPLAPAAVAGLMNMRGQIVTAVDLRRRMQLPADPGGPCSMHVVLGTEEGPMSLLVDQVDDVVEVAEDAYEAVPETLGGTVRTLVTGTYKLADRLLLVLDAERALRLEADPAPEAHEEDEHRC